jgi:NYN domain
VNLHHLLTFNFAQFAHSLVGTRPLLKATYYVGAVRTDGTAKTQHLFNHQRQLFAHLRTQSFTYSLGYLLKDRKGVFHEKGVDVNIAVDVLVAAYENVCDRLSLVSSDTDLIPAIAKAQEKGIIVVYVAFSHQVSKALLAACRVLPLTTVDNSDLSPFRLTASADSPYDMETIAATHFKQRGFLWPSMCLCSCWWSASSSVWRCCGVWIGSLFGLPPQEKRPSAARFIVC